MPAVVQATPDGLFEKQTPFFPSLPRIKLYKKLTGFLYNGQAGCEKLNCRSSKLSY